MGETKPWLLPSEGFFTGRKGTRNTWLGSGEAEGKLRADSITAWRKRRSLVTGAGSMEKVTLGEADPVSHAGVATV